MSTAPHTQVRDRRATRAQRQIAALVEIEAIANQTKTVEVLPGGKVQVIRTAAIIEALKECGQLAAWGQGKERKP